MQVHELAKRFIPLQGLKAEKLNRLAKSTESIRLAKGGLVFDFGDTAPFSYFLVQGELQLTTRDGLRIAINADDEQAAYPVGNLLPRQMRASIRSDSAKLLKIRRRDLDRLVAGGIPAANRPGMSIRDLTGIPQEMLSLLEAPLFSQLPKTNAKRLFRRFESEHWHQGDVIIREGETGEYFYFIRSGSCRVTRKSNGREILLNRLQAMDSFGESALITGRPRDATVTMESDGELMRIHRTPFIRDLVEPLLRRTPSDKAIHLAETGRARIIDIRNERKFAQDHLPGARNIPAYMLYLKRKSLSRQRHYIVHSDSGKQATAAAFVLLQQGLKTSVLGKSNDMPVHRVIDALILPGAAEARIA